MDAAPPRIRQAFREILAEAVAPRPMLTPRRVFGPVRLPGKATAVVGIRRAGKTTFVHQLREERRAQGTPGEHLPFVSFEDERFAGIDATHLHALVNERRRQHPSAADAPVLWCFGEIQVVHGWERFVRRLLDAPGNEVIVTGSSAALLSREIATALRGRAWQVLLHPFSFEEALRHQGAPFGGATRGGADAGDEQSRMERAFLDWLTIGGFPEAQPSPAGPLREGEAIDRATRHRLLRDYVDVAMLRDVVERHNVRNVVALRWLVRHLLANAGGLFSVEKFHAALKSQGVAVAKDTVHQLVAHLEDCFLVRLVWMESASERQRWVNPRKAYPVDTGLIPVFDRTGRSNVGHALETAVFIELERRGCEVTYLRTREGHEVDFVARAPDQTVELIQACATLGDPATAAREFRALIAAAERFPQARRRVLTLTRDDLPSAVPPGIEVQPAWWWMLGLPGD